MKIGSDASFRPESFLFSLFDLLIKLLKISKVVNYSENGYTCVQTRQSLLQKTVDRILLTVLE